MRTFAILDELLSQYRDIFQVMQIFGETEIILSKCGLGQEQYVEIAGKKIPRSFIRLYILAFPVLCCVMELIICINGYANGFSTILHAFVMLLTFSSGALIYSSLAMKSNKIVEMFRYLKSVVETSNG